MGLSKLLGPHTNQGLVSGLGGGVDGLASNTKTGTSGGDEDDAATLGQMRLNSLCEEDGALDVGVKVAVVEVLGCVYEVGLVALSGAVLSC